MKLKRDDAVNLFVALGLKTSAPKWTDEVLENKLANVGEVVRAGGKKQVKQLEEDDPEALALLKKVIKAQQAGEDIVLVGKSGKPLADEALEDDDDGEEAEADDGEAEGADAEDPDAEDEDEDDADEEDAEDEEDDGDDDESADDEDPETDEDDDVSVEAPVKAAKSAKKEVPAAKPAKPGKPPVKEAPKPGDKKGGGKTVPPREGKGGDGKPGVIASIVEFIQAASEQKPITKKEIHAKLVKRFPTNDADGMMKTINAQVPNRLIAQKGLNVIKTPEKGFFIKPSKSGKK